MPSVPSSQLALILTGLIAIIFVLILLLWMLKKQKTKATAMGYSSTC